MPHTADGKERGGRPAPSVFGAREGLFCLYAGREFLLVYRPESMESVLEVYSRCWRDVVALAGRGVGFVPFAIVAIGKTGALALIYFFWHPLFAGFMVPALRTLAGEPALHFPGHVNALPVLFEASELGLMLLFGFAMIVCAVFWMADTLEGKGRGWTVTAGHVALLTPAVALLAVCFVAGTIGVPMALNRVAEEFARRPKFQLLIGVGALGAGFLARVYLAYCPFFLRRVKGGAFAAIRDSVRFARGHSGVTVLIVMTGFVPEKVIEHLASDTGAFVANSRPEWVAALFFFKVVVEVFAFFFLFGAATSVAVGRAPR